MSSVSSSASIKLLVCAVSAAAVMLMSGCSPSETTKSASNSKKTQGYVVQLAHMKQHQSRSSASSHASKATRNRNVVSSAVARQGNNQPNKTTTLDRVVWNAQKQQGKKYVWGGESPSTGFDCSGLTKFAFGQGANISIPRTAADQYAVSTKIPQQQARKGDLVFFKTRGNRVSHVGIYLGNSRFLHAPRTGKAITTSTLNGYWAERLVGFGRIPGACRPVYG